MDFGLSDEHAALAATARAFVDRHCPPALAKEWDETGTFPEHLIKAMAEMGWFALAFPDGDGDGDGGEGAGRRSWRSSPSSWAGPAWTWRCASSAR